MAVREILQLGHPALWQIAESVVKVDSSEVVGIINDLSDTLADFRARYGFGRGIAAPQIGVLKRIIFVRMETVSFEGPLINPEIIERSESLVTVWDNCFSFADLMVRLTRAELITVRYQAGDGSEHELRASGDLSELLQHEIDHLDGILATDRAGSSHDLMTRQEWLRTIAK
jgi:peptide deformylase